ncbi:MULTISPECIES: YicC/YloC family endoribonuclease [Falsihalocynthiibacter]|uniref:YicC/YloC family endoribonuclease n=1 Tax=Falsihalocynthiibacter TaxID=2854182 RepID=UPI00300215C1
MTSFSAQTGGVGLYEWTWDMRGVNARGLDVRPRVPDWINGLEQEVKAKTSSRFSRGSIQISLKLNRIASPSELTINQEVLERVILAVQAVEAVAAAQKLTLSGVSALDLLTQKGVQEVTQEADNPEELKAVILTDFDTVLESFAQMRAVEGEALLKVLSEQMDRIEALTIAAATEAEKRKDVVATTLTENLRHILNNVDGAEPDRVAQELAMLAVKADVTEEIDRLHAHVGAARDLLASDQPIGRKLDFLSQEFNREANTLCAKAQAVSLTRIGLDLKAVIDQMREQVQNVE